MREILRMIVVLAVICGASGLLLAGVSSGTRDLIKMQELEYVKGPAVREVLAGCTNNPLEDVKVLKLSDDTKGPAEMDLFPALKGDQLWAIALEAKGKGFAGDVGVMVAVDIASESLLGIGITTSQETAGLGARVREPGFRSAFQGLALSDSARVRADGGEVDAVSGATISSRAVCEAVNAGIALYKSNRDKILALTGAASD